MAQRKAWLSQHKTKERMACLCWQRERKAWCYHSPTCPWRCDPLLLNALVNHDGGDDERVALLVNDGAAFDLRRLDARRNVDDLTAKDVGEVDARLFERRVVLSVAQHDGLHLGRQAQQGAGVEVGVRVSRKGERLGKQKRQQAHVSTRVAGVAKGGWNRKRHAPAERYAQRDGAADGLQDVGQRARRRLRRLLHKPGRPRGGVKGG